MYSRLNMSNFLVSCQMKISVWKFRLCELFEKLSRTCGIFHSVRHRLPTSFLAFLYSSPFSSFLQYGLTVWNLTYDIYITPIYLLEKKIIRAISFKRPTSPSTPIFSELEILNLYDTVELKLLSFVYESVSKISSVFSHVCLKL